jgi:hypothetical protein
MFGEDEGMAIEEGEGLGRFHQGEGGAGAGAEGDAGELAGGLDQADDVVEEFLADAHLADGLAEVADFVGLAAGSNMDQGVFVDLTGQDGDLVFGGNITEAEAHHEAVHLGFRQGIGSSEFDGVLGGDNEEEVGEGAGLAFEADLRFGHGFQQGGLGARGGAVDFVGQQDIGEDRPFTEMELLGLGMKDRDAQDVGGEEVRGELNAMELGVEGEREGFGEGGFAGAGEVIQEHMATGGEGGEESAGGRFLTAEDLADILGQPLEEGGCINRVA